MIFQRSALMSYGTTRSGPFRWNGRTRNDTTRSVTERSLEGERERPTWAKRHDMTLQDAADHLQIPKKRLWRAVKTGQLEAVQVQKGGRWEYRVTSDALEAYRRILETEDTGWNDAERIVSTGTSRLGMERPELDPDGTTDTERPGTWSGAERPKWNGAERAGTPVSPAAPAEVYIALIDRLTRAERRSVELELQLQQSRRLLTENAESIVEKEAFALEARAQLQAVEDAKQNEISRLSSELEAARLQLEEAQKPSGGFFSWLGLRKKRTSPIAANDSSKAV